jgi:hypothetical protein
MENEWYKWSRSPCIGFGMHYQIWKRERGKGVEALTKQKMSVFLEIPLPHIR